MLSWFERRLDPYPREEPTQPPRGLLAFCLHYTKGAKRWLLLMSFTSFAIAIIKISLFGFLGSIVDWLATVEPSRLFQDEWPTLVMMSAVLLVIFPAFSLLNALIIHQTLLGNLPQRIRWLAHRYLLRQSMSYFQDEFAGRIAAKLMQTSLAGARSGDEGARRFGLCRHLFRRCGRFRLHVRLAFSPFPSRSGSWSTASRSSISCRVCQRSPSSRRTPVR